MLHVSSPVSRGRGDERERSLSRERERESDRNRDRDREREVIHHGKYADRHGSRVGGGDSDARYPSRSSSYRRDIDDRNRCRSTHLSPARRRA